jgi:hypothetical protein
MGLPINFADVEEFKPLEAGTYDVRVTGAKVGKAGPQAKNPGDPIINVEFTVDDPDYPEYDGRKVWMNISLTEKALPYALRHLKRLGVSEEDLKSEDYEFEEEDILDFECRVVVTEDTERESNNVVRIQQREMSNLP